MTDLVQNLKIGNTAYGIVSVKDCLTGSSDPTTSTAGYVGQRYLNTTNNKVFVCTAITPHQTATNTHYTTSGGNWSYDGNTGILSQNSDFKYAASVTYDGNIDITNKDYLFVCKVLSVAGYRNIVTTSSGGYAMSYFGYSEYWRWFKVSGTADGSATTLQTIADNNYTRENLPTTGWYTESDSGSFSSGKPVFGGQNTNYYSTLQNHTCKIDLLNSYFVVDGVTYNLVDVETTFTYTWNQQASTADLSSKQNTLTAGNGIDISSDTISAEEMVGADGVNIGKAGAVPRPAATDNTKFLRGDGTWAEVGSTSYNPSTQEITLG